MFPPATPMGERVRTQNELRELERKAVRRLALTEQKASPRRSLLRVVSQALVALASVVGIGRVVTSAAPVRRTAHDC